MTSTESKANLFNQQRCVAVTGHRDEVLVEEGRVDGVAPTTIFVKKLPAVVVTLRKT
jgi:hypothetical protein